MEEFIIKYWPQFCALVGVVVLFVRLEGKILYYERRTDDLEKRQATLEAKHEALGSKLIDMMSTVQQTVARIEGILEERNNKRDVS